MNAVIMSYADKGKRFTFVSLIMRITSNEVDVRTEHLHKVYYRLLVFAVSSESHLVNSVENLTKYNLYCFVFTVRGSWYIILYMCSTLSIRPSSYIKYIQCEVYEDKSIHNVSNCMSFIKL